jgi:hypothetical protein
MIDRVVGRAADGAADGLFVERSVKRTP